MCSINQSINLSLTNTSNELKLVANLLAYIAMEGIQWLKEAAVILMSNSKPYLGKTALKYS